MNRYLTFSYWRNTFVGRTKIRRAVNAWERRDYIERLIRNQLERISLTQIMSAKIVLSIGGDEKSKVAQAIYSAAERELKILKKKLGPWVIIVLHRSSIKSNEIHHGHRTPCVHVTFKDCSTKDIGGDYYFIPTEFIKN